MSLRNRLLVAFVILTATFTATALALVAAQRGFLVDQVDQELERLRPFAAARAPLPVVPGGDPDGSENPFSELYLGLVTESGRMTTILRGALLDGVPSFTMSPSLIEKLNRGTPFDVDQADGGGRFRVISITEAEGEWSVIAATLAEVDGAVSRLQTTLVLAGTALFVVLAATFWWVHRLGLRPVSRLTAAADAVAAGERSHRVEVSDPRTEAGRLAAAFNVMLDSRDETEDRLRQFVADASHELRTPLTSILAYLDLYAQGEFRDPEALDDVMRRLMRESARMRDFVEDLLLLADLDQHRPLGREVVDLGAILHDGALDARAVQPAREITTDIADPLWVIGDRARLQQVVGALVTNALTHTGNDAAIRIGGHTAGREVVVTVADTGPGLPPDRANRVFDRFYRGDSARTRRTGGSGLGLAIAKSLVVAHDGTLVLDTSPGTGCRFRVTLPRAQPDAVAETDQLLTDERPEVSC